MTAEAITPKSPVADGEILRNTINFMILSLEDQPSISFCSGASIIFKPA